MFGSLGLAFALIAVGPAAALAVCGDVTGDGAITTTDALSVLRVSTGLSTDLACTCSTTTTSTTRTSTTTSTTLVEPASIRVRIANEIECGVGGSMRAIVEVVEGTSLAADSTEWSEDAEIPLAMLDADFVVTLTPTSCEGAYRLRSSIPLATGQLDPSYPLDVYVWVTIRSTGDADDRRLTLLLLQEDEDDSDIYARFIVGPRLEALTSVSAGAPPP